MADETRKKVLAALCDPHPLLMVAVFLLAVLLLATVPFLSVCVSCVMGCMAGEKDASLRVRRALSSEQGNE